MWSTTVIEKALTALRSDDAAERSFALQRIRETPTQDPRVVAEVRALLNDRNVVVMGIPYRYGEVRLLAAEALQAELGVVGIEEASRHDLLLPLSTDALSRLFRASGLPRPQATTSPDARLCAMYKALVEAGQVPRLR